MNYDVQLKEVYGNGHVESGDFGGAHGSNRIDVAALWVSHQNWDTPAGLGVAPSASTELDYGLGPSGGKDGGGTNTPTDVLYFSGQANANQAATTGGAMFTTRLGSRGVDVATWTRGSTTEITWPVTAHGDSVFIINVATAGSTLDLTPAGAFPEGHMVDVKKSGGSGTLQFNNVTVSAYNRFVFDGNAWHTLV